MQQYLTSSMHAIKARFVEHCNTAMESSVSHQLTEPCVASLKTGGLKATLPALGRRTAHSVRADRRCMPPLIAQLDMAGRLQCLNHIPGMLLVL